MAAAFDFSSTFRAASTTAFSVATGIPAAAASSFRFGVMQVTRW